MTTIEVKIIDKLRNDNEKVIKTMKFVSINVLREKILEQDYSRNDIINQLIDLINLLPAIDIAEEVAASEYRVPMKPISIKADEDIKLGAVTWKKGTTVYKCPRCNNFISRSNDFCNKCGQSIDF